MAALINGPFDANQFNPATGGGGQLGVGFHKVIIEASEVKPTAANDGGMIAYTLRCIEGAEQGGSQAYRLNMWNASDKAREIAQSQQSALCFVTGVFYVEDTQQLHNIPFYVEVVKQKNDEKYTEIRAVFDVNGCPPKSTKPEPRLIAFVQGGGAAQQQQAQAQQPAQQQQTQQQPAQQGGWGNNAGQTQQQQPVTEQQAPAQQPATAGGWQGGNTGGQPAQQGGWQGNNTAGQGQPQQQQQAQQQQQQGGWAQGANNGGAAKPSWGG
jgi:hypothetical protein